MFSRLMNGKSALGVDLDEGEILLVVARDVVGVVGLCRRSVVTSIFRSAARSTTCWLVTM